MDKCSHTWKIVSSIEYRTDWTTKETTPVGMVLDQTVFCDKCRRIKQLNVEIED